MPTVAQPAAPAAADAAAAAAPAPAPPPAKAAPAPPADPAAAARLSEDALLERAAALQARWRELALGFLPRWEDPPRGWSHFDYLLREARWLANDMAQERLWKRHAALKFAREAASAARARLERRAPAARDAAAAAEKAAAAAQKAAGGARAGAGGKKAGKGGKGGDATPPRASSPSLVEGETVALADEEKAALKAALAAAEAAETAAAYGEPPTCTG